MGLVLDAYALIGLLRDEPLAGEVEAMIRRGDTWIGVVNLAEVLDVLERRDGIARDEIDAAVQPLLGTGVEIVPMLEEHAWRAAGIRAQQYRRRGSALSLADCFLLATARPGDTVVTADEPVARAARAEGIGVAWLGAHA